ncbi:MAG: glycine--tRNA ligase subunit alpha, partial [Burkholderiaceae bacterium]
VENVYDLVYAAGHESASDRSPAGQTPSGRSGGALLYGDVFHQNEVEQSTYNFEHSNVEFLLQAFAAHEGNAQHLMAQHLALPAYEQVLKAAHTFNLLDARGAISVTERAAYIGRIRNLARSVAASYLDSRARLGFPLAPSAWAEETLAKLAAQQEQQKKAA